MNNDQPQIGTAKTLVLLVGPTGVGKTELALQLAQTLQSPIISCDSRQVFREIPIGTAAPTAEELSRVKHYFIGSRSIEEDYSAGEYERECIPLLQTLFEQHDTLLMTGGSMLYADAICNGLDELPHVPEEIRTQVNEHYRTNGIEWLQNQVQTLDPDYWEIVDRNNPARLIHCIEICLTTGKTYSSLRTNIKKERPFKILKIGLNRPRTELYERINQRVVEMMNQGLLEEAQKVYDKRHLTSLQTVGYRELFDYFSGTYDLDRAIALIQQNTRHYAKRQLTWFRRDPDIHWLNAQNDYETNIHTIITLLRTGSVQEK